MASEGKVVGHSKLPKFSFSFRRTKKEGASDSSSSSPEHQPQSNIGRSVTPTNSVSGSRSAPGSNESSPKVSRSKSLRLPRPTRYGLKSHSQSSISDTKQNGYSHDEDNDIYPDTKTVHVPNTRSGYPRAKSHLGTSDGNLRVSPRGRSQTISAGSSSSNPSSRSSSPGTVVGKENGSKRAAGRFGFSRGGSGLRGEGVAEGYGESLDQTDGYDDPSEDQTYSFQRAERRTQSFSVKTHTHVRSGSFGSKLAPPATQYGRNHPSRRSKTPTPTYKGSSSGLQQYQKSGQIGKTGSENGGKLGLSRTTSLGKVNKVKRVDENGTHSSRITTQQKTAVTRRDSSESRGRRPVSMVNSGSGGTPDLNKLAQEMAADDQPEAKSIHSRPVASKIPTTGSRRSHSALGHTHNHHHTYTRRTPSPTDPQPVSSTTSQTSQSGSSSSNDGSGVKSYEQATISSSAKVSRPGSSKSHYPPNRQGSFGSQSNLSTTSNEAYKYELSRRRSSTNLDTIDQRPSTSSGVHGESRRCSTPSSGRSTPVQRNTSSGVKKGKDSTDLGVVSSTTASRLSRGLPPRTPYRVARTMVPPSSGPVGMNELEGSVLLEADDYLRVCHDVKALKTVLLRLKREIQTDASGTPSTGAYVSTKVNKSRSTPSTDSSGSATVDLKKKMKQMATERDKALEEVGKLKNETKTLSSQVSSLTTELSTLQKTHSTLETENKQVEGHRDRLLDKVERLHADKHKLEHRLTSFEKARIYEQTPSESWLDEVDGDVSLLDLELLEDDEDMMSEDTQGSKVTSDNSP